MDAALFDSKIAAYLAGTLSTTDRDAFEAALRTDPELKKAYIRYRLRPPGQNPEDPEETIRDLARQALERTEPLPAPRFDWFLRLRYGAFSPGMWALVATVPMLVGAVLYANLALVSLDALPLRFFMPPVNPQTAGRAELEAAANAYWSVAPAAHEQLQTLADTCRTFCIAAYFLAHHRMRTGEYASAAPGFRASLEHLDLLRGHNAGDPALLQWNLALADFGTGGDRQKLERAIADLRSGPHLDPRLATKIDSAVAQLQHPLRRLSFF